MLKLTNITKTYGEKTNSAVQALKGISLNFRSTEFVSVLGPSGCGKTTLLNIIGGLDRYTSGGMEINGTSTKAYRDKDWDTYRNHSVGFVFQSYNLIAHQTILENVELSMTLGGVPKKERKKRAKQALISVGLGDKLNKRPNQLSGGQMQRVSIARALVGNPDIILADEPTGALDSETGVMVMELLKEISKTRLVIMVTHNAELAEQYSDRIIKMLDGTVIADTKPCSDEEEQAAVPEVKTSCGYKKKYSSMSFLTALRLSGKNLLSKKRRTFITSVAASIGLIGIAIILSVSNGMKGYINQTMLDSASFNRIEIQAETATDPWQFLLGNEQPDMEAYPENATGISPYKTQLPTAKKQNLSEAYLNYIAEKTDGLVVDVGYQYNVDLNLLAKNGDKYVALDSTNWNEALDNHTYVAEYYTVLAQADGATSAVPSTATEVAIVVDKYNQLPVELLNDLGIVCNENADGSYSKIQYEDLLGKEFRVVFNDGWYTPAEANGMTLYTVANATDYARAYHSEHGITVKIVSVLREKKDAPAQWLPTGIVYSPKLTKEILNANKDSAVALAQLANTEVDVATGRAFSEGNLTMEQLLLGDTATGTYANALQKLGCTQAPSAIKIYPKDTESRKIIASYLDDWNSQHSGTDSVVQYSDMSNMTASILGDTVDIITSVLMAFSITSLVISAVMIAIIIYASVLEREKEIGVLRAIGARKRDISRVFKAEAIILGFVSGLIAIGCTVLINLAINAILYKIVGVSGIANLASNTAVGLVVLSMVILLIAGIVPAKMAAKKDPIAALRTE